MTDIELLPLLEQIAQQYTLDPEDIHGLNHWARVLENGLKLAEAEGGDPTVVRLFAIFHDACRRNQSIDNGHGERAAHLAGELLHNHPSVNEDQLFLLQTACREHTDGKTDADLTVRICWDSDRLDLARVFITPKEKYLCTPTARSIEVRKWANQRARDQFSPEYVESTWKPVFDRFQPPFQNQ
jgi:uncharacterized protein